MKRIFQSLVIVSALCVLPVACKKETAAPLIKNMEIGHKNSKKATVGKDLHLEAEIIAEAKIANIRVVIHHEEGEAHAPAADRSKTAAHEDEWKIDTTYTGAYANVKNAVFHEHIKIPASAEPGSYHLHLFVTDLEGKRAKIDEDITLLPASELQ